VKKLSYQSRKHERDVNHEMLGKRVAQDVAGCKGIPFLRLDPICVDNASLHDGPRTERALMQAIGLKPALTFYARY
jgi:hypothetical protein